MSPTNFNQKKSNAKTLMISGLLSISAVTTGVYSAEIYAAEQPNIIYILADDMGQGDTTVYNPASKIATPSLDRLAKEGMTFSNMHSNSSVCTPTRYGVITGRYAWRTELKNGVLGGYSRHLIDPNRETVPSLLKKQGYDTAMFGKWHLGMDMASTDGKKIKGHEGKNADLSQAIKNGPNVNGFDYYFGIAASLNHSPHAFIENDRVLGELHFIANKKEKKKLGIDGKMGWAAKGWRQDNVQNTFIDKTIEWLEQHQKTASDKPFFVYLPLNSPHSPIAPSEKFIGKSGLSPHGDFTMEMDYEIGRLLNKLDELKIADNTLVIFTSDNGTSPKAKLEPMQAQGHYSHMGYRGLKGSIYEGGHRVPFIVRWPDGVKAGTKTDYHGSLVDLMATAAELTNTKLADNAGEDSVSFLPVLAGKKVDDSLRGVVYHSDAGAYSIRQGKWKLILHESGGSRRSNPKDKNNPVIAAGDIQLFDMDNDPTERVSIHKQNPEIATNLMKVLEIQINSGRSAGTGPAANDKIDAKSQSKWQKKLGKHITL
ncbi:sulfatase family protein [Colwellia piezophila]|uniref:sulfatase family protein n=1 Tax=Colwellia piezophila TaxID=211668 RepID=UPI00035CB803|nr:arylsulfatase [Colwellia piezophila]